MGRILAIDFGKKRIGLARSSEGKEVALPFKTLHAGRTLEETATRVLQECQGIEKIVLGLPLLLSGGESETTRMVRAFAALLEKKSSLPLVFLDERLTSKEVEKRMIEGQVKRRQRVHHLDMLCATLILQTYLDQATWRKEGDGVRGA